MKAIGLDIGTTTISAVVFADAHVIESRTIANDSQIRTENDWERLQDPKRILQRATELLDELMRRHPDTACIGLTGQQHGILYVDAQGEPLSPLYTWQDGRGNQPYDAQTSYAGRLTVLTGYPMATGFGLTTHFYNLRNNLVPENAVTFCAIHDFVAMKLAGLTQPRTEASDAASFGLFDVRNNCFDPRAVRRTGMDPKCLPELAEAPLLGVGALGIPVFAAIGDNQASFLGSVGGEKNCMLANIGTGGQFSVHTETYMDCDILEMRPYPAGGYLLVGSLLCAGRAYALLEEFFRATAEAMTGQKLDRCYDAMARLGAMPVTNPPVVTPLFQGTRQNPSLRASVANLAPENFTPQHLLAGMMRGMARELYELYLCYKEAGGTSTTLIGSGNGLRKNANLCRCVEEAFGMKMRLSLQEEEAATGAARFALMSMEKM